MYTWPCAPVLAQYICHHCDNFRGKHVLELGAGTALPGIVAAKIGASVTLSDSAQLPKCLHNCIKSCESNNLTGTVQVVGLTWGIFSQPLLNLPPVHCILASDCFYDPSVFEDIIVSVVYLLEHNPGAEFLFTYQERSADWCLEPLLKKWSLKIEQIPLASFNGDSTSLGESDLPGNHSILLFRITK